MEGSPERTKNLGASQAPIKQRVKMVEKSISDGKVELNNNKKEMQVLRSECATLEAKNKETTNEILKEILEDIANLDKDFKKLVEMDNNEVKFLQQQLFQLTQEKTKLQQSVVMLDTRVANVENDVGFE
uniref:Uncharacterized protein n=1 Tax=Euplotes harpa TaxID=151035 RepID=A0A7S3J6X2_9SPIT|mmetsp:Transcript_18688/g.21477  ORF Transcript_18688/g.21477 Transcript_18688/m.21477 type:complete len:129 (+) Transcript_18688:17-403(+)